MTSKRMAYAVALLALTAGLFLYGSESGKRKTAMAGGESSCSACCPPEPAAAKPAGTETAEAAACEKPISKQELLKAPQAVTETAEAGK